MRQVYAYAANESTLSIKEWLLLIVHTDIFITAIVKLLSVASYVWNLRCLIVFSYNQKYEKLYTIKVKPTVNIEYVQVSMSTKI